MRVFVEVEQEAAFRLQLEVAVSPDLATVGGLASDPCAEKLAESRRVAFLASTFSLSDNGSSEPLQSLMVGTMMRVSLRVKSGPRELLTGPIGPEITGRFFFPCEKTLDGVGRRSREEDLWKPVLFRKASIVVVVVFGRLAWRRLVRFGLF